MEKALAVNLEIEDDGSDGFVVPGVEFDQLRFSKGDGFHLVVSGCRSSRLIGGVRHVAAGIDVDVYGDFRVLVKVIGKGGSSGDVTSRQSPGNGNAGVPVTATGIVVGIRIAAGCALVALAAGNALVAAG